MNLPRTVLLIFALVLCVSSNPTSINALGTTLPQLTSASNYRIFNDLMKQSLPIVPYQVLSYGISRCWSNCTITFINNQSNQYPSSLGINFYAVAEIPFFNNSDSGFINQNFTLSFSGSGIVGVLQKGLNKNWTSGDGGTFILPAINSSLMVYIYNTTSTNLVNSIKITLTSLGTPAPTYTTSFLSTLQPFNLIRTCYWQGQNLYNSGFKSQIWANRTLTTSSTQISSTGVALEHILQLENFGLTLWACIPDTADTNYITQMATLFAGSRTQSKMIYMQFGNVYTIMNNFPDQLTNPAFSTFMQSYGATYRSKVLFTINYQYIQYYINALGMRVSPPINFTYIDAIGFSGDFGVLDATTAYGLNDSALKAYIINTELTYETTVNTAYQLSKRNGTDFVMYSGGPYLKTPRYGWNWKYSQNTSNLTVQALAAQETSLYATLLNMTLNDAWTQELYLHWIARLTSMGVNSIAFSQLFGIFTTNSDFVPLLADLSSTTQIYTALRQYAVNGRATTLPVAGTVPANPFTCSPTCVWGDCIMNTCSCYAGYSGNDCSSYTAPNTQNNLGVNVQGVSYWTTQTPFIDMHREGSAWVYFIVNGGWSSGNAYQSQITFDSEGYPTYLPPGAAVGTLMARDVKTHYDNGTYVVLYDGEGILTFGMFDVPSVRYGIGRVEIDVVPSTNMNNGILVTIARTNPNNHVRNIRVIRPGYEGIWQAITFSPYVLTKLQPFGTLRFMDWTNTNSQSDVQWANRTKTSWRTYTSNGVAWEEVIKLANTLGKNVWINVPYQASNDYITQLAQLFNTTLEPHLKVYVEYSNEVWGTQFLGGQYAQNMGVKLNYSSNDPTQARFCYLGQRTQDISDIWNGVYGQNNPNLQIIVSTQAVNADTTRRILACRNTYLKVNGVAIAPYLSVTMTSSMTLDTLFSKLTSQVGLIGPMVAAHLNYTKNYSLPLLCYESGQGLVGSDSTTTNLQVTAQTDVRMRAIQLSYLETLFNNSIVLANQYTDTGSYGSYGSWGLFQYADDGLYLSQKWLGVSDYFTEQNSVTGVLSYASCATNCNNGICAYGKCNCYSGYSGSDCSVGKYIDYVDCGYLCTFNQGTCGMRQIVGINRYFQCTCNAGYTGYTCSNPICSSSCSYAGTCVAPQTCNCFRGKAGTNCDIDCGCGGHGTCSTNNTCLCDSGYNFNVTSKKCEFTCYGQASANCYGPSLLTCAGCSSGTCNNGTCTCWPGYSGVNCSTPTPVNFVNSNLGINLAGLSYWSTQHLLKDYFKQSSTWIPQYYPGYFNSSIAYTWNTSQSFPTLPNGYPSMLYANMTVGKLLLRDLQGYYPNINQTNQYVLLYDGDGVISLAFDATVTEYSAGRIKFTVIPSTVRDNGVYVRLLQTNPANPVQNIRVILAQDEYTYNQDLLTDNFMRFITQFSTIRFMDLLETNGSPVSEWNQTTLPSQDTQAMPSGISIDLLTKIINRSGRNAWINVPHLASDDYVNKLASFLKANLSASSLIYVEYSNEVWNSFFAQGQYAINQSKALNLSNAHKFYGTRSLQIFNIFSTVFGSTTASRLKFVISYQAVSSWVANQIMTTTVLINNVNVTVANVTNVIASAPYYDCNSIGNAVNTAVVATETPDDVITTCNNQFASLQSILQTGYNVSISYGNISMATYEAGTSISEQQAIYTGGNNPAATVNFIAANRAPGMYNVYKTLLNNYQQSNYSTTGPTMLFSSIGLPSKYGSWGLLDYMDQINEEPTHPKFQAVLDYNQGK